MKVLQALEKRERERKAEKVERLAIVFRALGLMFLGLVVGGVAGLGVNAYKFVDANIIVVRSPVIFQDWLEVKPREVTINITKIEAHKIETETDTEAKICEAFGVADCKMALAIMKAESGGKVEAYSVNTNGSIDVGLFQINSVHFNTKGCSLGEVVTEAGNIACALSIFQKSGWSPWVAYTSGAFQKFLK